MSTSVNSCNKEVDDGVPKSCVCQVNDMLRNLSTADDVLVCANCGKEGSNNDMNTCNKCKMVKYCNAVCKKVHKKKHKKDCEEYIRLATEKRNEELRIAAELHDKELFKQPPPAEDCQICFIRIPSLDTTGRRYMTCCGKVICSGCYYAPVYDHQGNEVADEKCAFCRTPNHETDEEYVKRIMKRMEVNDAIAIHNVGCYYQDGTRGFPQNNTKALELLHRAAELGFTGAYTNIGIAYLHGSGVEVDMKKANHYWELAAIGGDASARANLGQIEKNAGNMDRALKHYMIAVRDGFARSLNKIKELYSKGNATKDDYTTALRLYQEYLKEIKSDQRDKAAAADEDNRYY